MDDIKEIENNIYTMINYNIASFLCGGVHDIDDIITYLNKRIESLSKIIKTKIDLDLNSDYNDTIKKVANLAKNEKYAVFYILMADRRIKELNWIRNKRLNYTDSRLYKLLIFRDKITNYKWNQVELSNI